MHRTSPIKTRKYWTGTGSRFGAPGRVKPDGLYDAPEFLVRLIGRQNADLLELLSTPKTLRSRRA